MLTRVYRVHVFDGQYEVLHKRTFTYQLDLESPRIGERLDRLLQALTRTALAENEPMDSPRLEVRDSHTGIKLLDWTGA